MFSVGRRQFTVMVQVLVGRSGLFMRYFQCLHLSASSALHAGMIGNNTSRPTMPSGEWAPQSSAVRVTCAATSGAMNRPIQGGMIRNPTASIPMRANSQPGQRQMLQSQVMNIGKAVEYSLLSLWFLEMECQLIDPSRLASGLYCRAYSGVNGTLLEPCRSIKLLYNSYLRQNALECHSVNAVHIRT